MELAAALASLEDLAHNSTDAALPSALAYFNFFFGGRLILLILHRDVCQLQFLKLGFFKKKIWNAKRPGGEPQPEGRSLETDSSHACTASAWDVHY